MTCFRTSLFSAASCLETALVPAPTCALKVAQSLLWCAPAVRRGFLLGSFLSESIRRRRTPPSPFAGSTRGFSLVCAPKDAGTSPINPSPRSGKSFFQPSRCGDVFIRFDALFALLELTWQWPRNESDGVFREDPGGRSVWRWEYKSLQPDRTSGYAVQESDSKGRCTARWAWKVSHCAPSCIHSTAPTWRCSPAAETEQATVGGLLSVKEPAKNPPLSQGVCNSTIPPRVKTKVGPVCILCEEWVVVNREWVSGSERKVCMAVCVCVFCVSQFGQTLNPIPYSTVV